MQIKDKLTIREIQCNEPLIFNILAWSKGFYENEWNVNIGLNLGKELIKLSSVSKDSIKRLNTDIHIIIKNLIKIHIRYKENEFGKLKGNLKEFQEKYRERKNIKIVYIHSVEEQVYNIGLTSYSIVNNNVLNSLKKEILDWNFGIVEYTQCDDITQTSKFIFKEIDCNQPLIFKILERSKDYYENEWKVRIKF